MLNSPQRRYPTLGSYGSEPVLNPLEMCIVTPDIHGPVRNGGIGTANYHLAVQLANAGHQITVLFTQSPSSLADESHWVRFYKDRGITLVYLKPDEAIKGKLFPEYEPLTLSLATYRWLRNRSFEAIVFMEWQANGFYTFEAKRAGEFSQTVLLTQTHSPSLWHAMSNAMPPSTAMESILYYMERRSIELADGVISPSQYMLTWCRQQGMVLPYHSIVQPNLLSGMAPDGTPAQPVSEIVFFGRLEFRKGIVQFCNAIDRLAALGNLPTCVTFLGKFGRVGDEHAGLYIGRRAAAWNTRVQIHSRLDKDAALAYLSQPGKIAVMPSVSENSPYTVYECLLQGIPFFARNVGGIAELVHSEDAADYLFDDNPASLARLIGDAIGRILPPPRLAFELQTNVAQWQTGLPSLIAELKKPVEREKPAQTQPLITVCLCHFQRPHLLSQALQSLREQDYPNFEVVLVDDGSKDAESSAYLESLNEEFDRKKWKIIRLENGYLGRARNEAVAAAKGEYVLFMDDDNVGLPHMLSSFMQAASASQAGLVTSAFNVFDSKDMPTACTPVVETFVPIGGILSYSLITNAIGDANSLIRKVDFHALGGFSEDYGVGHEDFELYLKAALSGVSIAVIPEPLFWYRRIGNSMLQNTNVTVNSLRSFRPFLSMLPAPLAEMATMAFGLTRPKATSNKISADGLTLFQKNALSTGDPDASETVKAVAAILANEGQPKLAEMLLSELQNVPDNRLAPLPDEATRIREQLRAGRLKHAEMLLNKYIRKHSDADTIVMVCSHLAAECVELKIDTTSFLHAILRPLKQHGAQRLDVQLELSEYFIFLGSLGNARHHMRKALELGDAEYLRARPDVKHAVAKGAFSTGYEHYLRHGRDEGCEWPMAEEFANLLSKIGN